MYMAVIYRKTVVILNKESVKYVCLTIHDLEF